MSGNLDGAMMAAYDTFEAEHGQRQHARISVFDAGFRAGVALVARSDAAGAEGEVEHLKAVIRELAVAYDDDHNPCWCVTSVIMGRTQTDHGTGCRAARAALAPAPVETRGTPRPCCHCDGTGRERNGETCIICEGTACSQHTLTVSPSCGTCRIA